MKKLFLVLGLFSLVFLTKDLRAQTTDILNFPEDDGNQWLTSVQLRYTYFTMPACWNYDVRELGINIDATSQPGDLRLAIYTGSGDIMYQTSDISVTGGIEEYVSTPVAPGSVTLMGGETYRVAVMCDPSSPVNMVLNASSAPTNSGVATNLSTSSWAIYSGLAYPTFPGSLYFDGASFRAFSAVIKGDTLSQGSPSTASQWTTNITETSAKANWEAVDGADKYRLHIREKAGPGPWMVLHKPDHLAKHKTFNGLTPNTTYQWQTKTISCGGSGISKWAPVQEFTTLPANCAVTVNLQSSNVTDQSVTLSWDEQIGADGYKVRYKPIGPGPYRYKTLFGSNSTTVNNYYLQSSSTYEWQVRTFCPGGGQTGWTPVENFNTLTPKTQHAGSTTQSAFDRIRIYPNPANNWLQINGPLNPDKDKIMITDVLGRSLAVVDSDIPTGNSTTIDVSEFSQGVYFLTIVNKDFQKTFRFVKTE